MPRSCGPVTKNSIPGRQLDQFYQQHGLDLQEFMKHKAAEQPIYVTPEGQPAGDL